MKKIVMAAALTLSTSTMLAGAAFAAPARPAAPAQAAAASAQPAAQAPRPDADPAMWVVRDADTTIYLFGTFHMLDGTRDWFNDEVRTAFDRSNELVLEADIPGSEAEQQQAMMPFVMRYAVDQSGRTLSSRLTADENQRLQRVLAGTGAPAGAFDRFEPWFMGMTLSALAASKPD